MADKDYKVQVGVEAKADTRGLDQVNKGLDKVRKTARQVNEELSDDSAASNLEEVTDAAEETAKLDAGTAIETLASTTVSEAQIENLVVAKGYADCVAFMGENSISVVVSAAEDGLQTEDVAKIKDITMTETGFPASGIKIMAAN